MAPKTTVRVTLNGEADLEVLQVVQEEVRSMAELVAAAEDLSLDITAHTLHTLHFLVVLLHLIPPAPVVAQVVPPAHKQLLAQDLAEAAVPLLSPVMAHQEVQAPVTVVAAEAAEALITVLLVGMEEQVELVLFLFTLGKGN